ncbi:MAG: hypothetical protein M3P93_00445 [Actinomycetota bacterium]|nr:hypothetical protein [Actinomycetota bacterium]
MEGVQRRRPALSGVGEGFRWRNRVGEVHTIEALDDAQVLEVSTPELDDVVRLTDHYGRAGASAP